MADTQVQLGDFTFASYEIPERIPFGGEQRLKVHELVGGQKVVDAMGWFPKSLSWSGWFFGAGARDRALYVQGLFRAGKALTLTWDSFRYQVVPKSFEADFERAYQLPYTLTLEVVQDQTAPITTITAVTVDDQTSDDMDSATDYGDDVGDATLTTNLAGVAAAIGSVTSFVGATAAEIGSVLTPLAIAQARVAALQATNTAAISTGSTFCGVAAGGSPTALAASLTAYNASMITLASLQGLSDVLERISVNLSADGASGAVLTQAGGSLYAIAASAYGSPEEWSTLAEANNLSDPILTGINQLRVPAQPDGAGGVWQ